ncbi:MAG: hypothetical protein IT437_05005 [Phycisphaerales bacterium]|nr:hypothetical protein [Phycisphaerales bacterium]
MNLASPRSPLVTAAGIAALGLALMGGVAMIGGPDGEAPARLAAVAFTLVKAGVPAGAYLLGSVGIGRPARALWRGARNPWPIQAAVGLTLTLTLSHGLGTLGLLNQVASGAVTGAGLLLLAHQLAGARARGEIEPRLPAWALLALAPTALLLVAACQPPGWLWASEAGGYDAMSYHLELPREWVRGGWIEPLTHNVYSYLPSYMESAFTHLAVLCGAGSAGPPFPDLLAGEGWLLISCQLLHSAVTLLACWIVARAGAAAATACGADRETARRAGAIAGCLLLATPWTIVVGSLAYNEMGMAALGAAAMLVSLEPGLAPWRRGVLAGLLVGGACGCKPTAILFFGPSVGILLLARSRPGEWAAVIGACAGAGLLMLAPWLARNALHGGNPVFPAAAAWFGSAHWSAEQVSRYARAHSFDGSIADRLRLLVLPGDEAHPLLSAHRGLLHPQWAAFFPVTMAAAVAACIAGASRRLGIVLVAGLVAQILAWLFLTHLQSRFLIPLAVPACMVAALAAAGAGGLGRCARAGLALVILIQTGASILRFSREHDGGPNALLVAGPGFFTGELMGTTGEGAALPPQIEVNLARPPGRVYLLGSATPLYYAAPVVYNTTWDRWPLGDAIRAAPEDTAHWSASLRALGVRWVLVDFAELDRLHASAWSDPDVTPHRLRDWLRPPYAVPARQWQSGQAMFDLGAGP